MNINQANPAALVILLIALFCGGAIAKRGGKLLTESQRSELTAMNPDVLGILGIVGAVGFVYLASRLHAWSVVGAVVFGAITFVRIPLRMYRQSWPRAARAFLLLGNAVLIGGAELFTVIRAIPYITS